MASGTIIIPKKFVKIGDISNNSSTTFVFGNSSQHLCLVSGAYNGHHALFIVSCDSGGTGNISIIYKANTLTITAGKRELTIASTQAGTAVLYDYPIIGAAMTVSE